MARLADYKGQFSAIARDPAFSQQVSALIRLNPASRGELKSVLDEIRRDIHEIAMNHTGSWFLVNLLRSMNLVSEAVGVFSELLTIDVLGHDIGIQTLFSVMKLCPPNQKQEFLSFLESRTTELLLGYMDLTLAMDVLFDRFSATDLEPFLIQVAANFLQLSFNDIGNKNLLLLINHAGPSLLSLLADDGCLVAAFDKKGFMVDNVPIRVFNNAEQLGVPFPKNQPMKIYSSLWNADDWATRGRLVKTDWSKAPFTFYYRGFNAAACTAT